MASQEAATGPSAGYARCPKCGHAPLPEDQSLPAACPACGLVLAKHAQAWSLRRAAAGRALRNLPPLPRAGKRAADAAGLLLAVPERVDTIRFRARVALLALFTAWGLQLIALDYRDGEIAGSFVHRPLLVFHEAGHFLFRPLGEFMMTLGGTLGQLALPVGFVVALLLQNRDPFGAAFGLWFTGVSLLDVAPYVYDALRPQLILLGGGTGELGNHDWLYLLSATGLLAKAHSLGWLVHKLGACVTLLALAWAMGLLWRQYARLAGDVLDERGEQ